MPTVTDPLHIPAALAGRRQALALLAGLGGWALVPQAARAAAGSATGVQLAAAWERQGRFHIGLLLAQEGAGQPMRIHAALEVPTRAHGLCVLPDGTVLAAARRPGDWLVRWHPRSQAPPQWLWQDGERAFNGHAIASADGQQLYTTETDIETGASLVGVRDARSLERLAEWPTHGIDAHELVWDARTLHGGAPTLIVANGGVPTAPETGRAKRDLDTMDSSLVRLDAASGAVLGQWRLQDPRLSLRHLAFGPDGRTLGIALQAEHGDAAAKNAAPVLALFDGATLRTVPAPGAVARSIRGYGGSIAATGLGWAVGCPRAGGIATYSPAGAWITLVPLAEACALAVGGGALWAGGWRHSLQGVQAEAPATHPHADGMRDVRLDNHWAHWARQAPGPEI